MGDPQTGVSASAQCIQNTCVQATPNLSCEYFPNGCNTIVSGFLAGNKKPLFESPAGFYLYNVSDEMKMLGVEDGDILTHIDGFNMYDLNRFKSITEQMPLGTKLTIRKKDRTYKEITL